MCACLRQRQRGIPRWDIVRDQGDKRLGPVRVRVPLPDAGGLQHLPAGEEGEQFLHRQQPETLYDLPDLAASGGYPSARSPDFRVTLGSREETDPTNPTG